MKKILFPTDFSSAAENALKYALHLAADLNAELHFLHVYHYTMPSGMYVPDELKEALEVEMEEDAKKHLQKYTRQQVLELDKPVPVEHHLVYGFAQEQIVKIATEIDANMIVMGTTGASSALEKMIGSVTAAIMAEGPCPVLAIPDGYPYKPIKEITYASSFEDGETNVFEKLCYFVNTLKANMSCLHIKKPSEDLKDPLIEAYDKYFMDQVSKRNLSYFLLEGDDVRSAIEHFLEINKTDVLAMLTHRRSLLAKLLNPSLTRELAMKAQLPLLAFQKGTVHHLAKA